MPLSTPNAAKATNGATLTPDFPCPFLRWPAVERLFAAYAAASVDIRIVGGAVRDAALSRPITDLDLATPATPDESLSILAASGIRTIKTGIEHGTITAVIDHRPFEITTLRRDVTTDGRRATVAFTKDWQEDAARRDFTMNALSLSKDGTLYDYFSGLADARAGRVRFIGDPQKRLAEDHLRALRFFRFHAGYGKGTPDAGALAACLADAANLASLSGERIWAECRKLFLAHGAAETLNLMIDENFLSEILPAFRNKARLNALIRRDDAFGFAKEEGDALRRLAAGLMPEGRDDSLSTNPEIIETIAARLRLSGSSRARLARLLAPAFVPQGHLDPVPLRQILYNHGTETVRDTILLHGLAISDAALRAALEIIEMWERPLFPLTGEDVLAKGVNPGPQVGVILGKAEAWWAARDFRPTRDECLSYLKSIA